MASSKKRGSNEINASSMADIAFLLLIFFLVTTTIDVDKGILHKLPPFIDEPQDIPPINKRNVLEILINAQDYLLVEGQYLRVNQLREITKKHITNNGRLPDFSDSPDKAVVSLKNDRGTSYDIYLQVQNELKAAYRELRDVEAKRLTSGSLDYSEISKAANPNTPNPHPRQKYYKGLKSQIKAKYPMKISEAEPEDLSVN